MPTTAIALFLGKQVGSLVAKKFGTSIIERWTRRRAEAFFAGFLQVLEKEFQGGVELKDVDAKLDEILGDEKRSEVLFDAYRSVCFSKSRTLGPRIIGLLAGIIVLEGRMSDNDEDQVFKAAEELSDLELDEFSESYRSYRLKVANPKNDKDPYIENGSLVIPWSEDHRNSAWAHSRQEEIDISPLDMREALGAWAAVLERLGVVASKMSNRRVEYKEDSERHIDEDGVLDIYSFSVIFRASARLLADLSDRARRVSG